MAKLRDELLLIRADASVAIGTGHVMRCLALAQAWQDAGGAVTFAMAESTSAIEDRLRSEGASLVRIDGVPGSHADAKQFIALARIRGPAWLAVDGYEFGADYQCALKQEGFKVVLIDDHGRSAPYAADIVLNQNLSARQYLYKDLASRTRLLLGTKYALLRREFVAVRSPREIPSIARNLFVSLGGSDPDNVTCRVMDALEQVAVEGLQVAVVAGGSNPHIAALTESVAKSSQGCRVLNNVTNMQELISWADLAISAAGGACWEYCALGLPAVLVAVAENQMANAEALHAAGAATLLTGGSRFAIGDMARTVARLANSPVERQALSQTARSLVDGEGAARTVAVLLADASS